jgi:hypothetical protein
MKFSNGRGVANDAMMAVSLFPDQVQDFTHHDRA